MNAVTTMCGFVEEPFGKRTSIHSDWFKGDIFWSTFASKRVPHYFYIATAKMYANVIILFNSEIVHVGYKISQREIEPGIVPLANTVWLDYRLRSIGFKLHQNFSTKDNHCILFHLDVRRIKILKTNLRIKNIPCPS